jgi:SepF-like predicted cell division protein (DUF552 family)
MSIEQIFDFMNKSNLTIVGYKFQDERIKDEFISKLPHIEIFEFDSSFSVISSLKQKVRENKIDFVLEGSSISNMKFVVVDLSNFKRHKDLSDMVISRSISEFVEKMRKEIVETKYKLVILSPVNSNPMGEIPSFTGGSRTLYMADLVYVIEGKKINIVKNRIERDNVSVSLENLKDYKYICNYENNN